ncbi:AraC family transcriptional regulator [Phenylobacterium sp.]|uniref:AraC family transcriptional regulator n=1 Tax=Phenylobacterium sp. TaxID=1871053 RepID=UPI002FCC5B96
MDRSTRGIDYQNVPRPIAALADEYPNGYHDPRHTHRRAQLIYASAGILLVITEEASFVVPPQRAVWVPAGMEHEAYARGNVSIRTLYVEQGASNHLPTASRAIEVSSLLRELILAATQMPLEYDLDGRDGRVMTLILDELTATRAAPSNVPMPHNERLAKVCASILREPAQCDALDDWAAAAGMGRRTFTRTFRRETGISFATWRQNVRLMEAVSRLSMGEPVTTVAFDVGYNSSSAFTAMFRRTFGVAPTRYIASQFESAASEP